MSSSDDALKIPIEVKTEDLDEIRALINEISQAENDVRALKATPRKGRASGDQSSRSAFSTPEARDDRGGIFGSREGPATPATAKDKKSATPFQRESEFAKLKNQVQEQEQRKGTLSGLQGGLNQGFQGAVNLATSNNKGGFILGKLGAVASNAFLPLTVITSIVGLVQQVLDAALAPGGPLDRRFKRDIGTEIANANSLEKKQAINQGFKVVRTQVYPNLRGEAGVSSSLRQNKPIYDLGIARNMAGLP